MYNPLGALTKGSIARRNDAIAEPIAKREVNNLTPWADKDSFRPAGVEPNKGFFHGVEQQSFKQPTPAGAPSGNRPPMARPGNQPLSWMQTAGGAAPIATKRKPPHTVLIADCSHGETHHRKINNVYDPIALGTDDDGVRPLNDEQRTRMDRQIRRQTMTKGVNQGGEIAKTPRHEFWGTLGELFRVMLCRIGFGFCGNFPPLREWETLAVYPLPGFTKAAITFALDRI